MSGGQVKFYVTSLSCNLPIDRGSVVFRILVGGETKFKSRKISKAYWSGRLSMKTNLEDIVQVVVQFEPVSSAFASLSSSRTGSNTCSEYRSGSVEISQIQDQIQTLTLPLALCDPQTKDARSSILKNVRRSANEQPTAGSVLLRTTSTEPTSPKRLSITLGERRKKKQEGENSGFSGVGLGGIGIGVVGGLVESGEGAIPSATGAERKSLTSDYYGSGVSGESDYDESMIPEIEEFEQADRLVLSIICFKEIPQTNLKIPSIRRKKRTPSTASFSEVQPPDTPNPSSADPSDATNTSSPPSPHKSPHKSSQDSPQPPSSISGDDCTTSIQTPIPTTSPQSLLSSKISPNSISGGETENQNQETQAPSHKNPTLGVTHDHDEHRPSPREHILPASSPRLVLPLPSPPDSEPILPPLPTLDPAVRHSSHSPRSRLSQSPQRGNRSPSRTFQTPSPSHSPSPSPRTRIGLTSSGSAQTSSAPQFQRSPSPSPASPKPSSHRSVHQMTQSSTTTTIITTTPSQPTTVQTPSLTQSSVVSQTPTLSPAASLSASLGTHASRSPRSSSVTSPPLFPSTTTTSSTSSTSSIPTPSNKSPRADVSPSPTPAPSSSSLLSFAPSLSGKSSSGPTQGPAMPHYTEIPPSEIVMKKKLGFGATSSVFLGTYKDETVAVKVLYCEDETSFKEFRAELAILCASNHPFIIKVLGASTKENQLTIVYEFFALGSLDKVLHKDKIPMDWALQLHMMWNIAEGLVFLHKKRNIIHRDLKPANVLVRSLQSNAPVNVVLGDFGTAKKQIRNQDHTKGTGTPAYMAPEQHQAKAYTNKVDIYSWAITSWELRNRIVPFSDVDFQYKIYNMVVLEGVRPVNPPTENPDLAKLFEECWHQDPSLRPDSETVVGRLRGIMKATSVPDVKRPSNSLFKKGFRLLNK